MKDIIVEMRDAILSKIEKMDEAGERTRNLRKDFENFSHEINTEIKILNHEIEKNEKKIQSIVKNLSEYVLNTIENNDDSLWFASEKQSIWRRCVTRVLSFCDKHGPIIAYTLLLSGLVSFLTYMIITRII